MPILGQFRPKVAGGGRPTRMLVILGFLVILTACGTSRVVLDNQTPLVKNQPHQGFQKSMNYQLEYSYVFTKGEASEPDRIAFTGKLTPRRGLVTLAVRLHLLDASGNVLATQVLYAPGAGQGAGKATIERQIDVPPGTISLAFSDTARDQPITF